MSAKPFSDSRPGIVLPAALAVWVSGCATTDCDPGQGGFFRGLGCSASGSYGQRQQQMQASLDREQQTQAGLQSRYAQANQAAIESDAQRQAAEEEYAGLQRDIDALNARLAQSKSKKKDLSREIRSVQNQLDLLKADTMSPRAELDKRRAELDRRLKELEREVDLARGK
ncbi:putative lipoprotein [Methylococcus capsulatus str. Bath]|uniref:Putative lipoprotein n=1 Tax=Methylococcus capsulatus (strain ATCC 33009 / NCIMB 11132 / Bath) TaxID=243233 RepID=Q605Y0_METCA|nr:lipoprotein [Methylococcus capsulatus]AAU91654.1 putative lipoprotein [Methylococcus capsulatus str. Bath]